MSPDKRPPKETRPKGGGISTLDVDLVRAVLAMVAEGSTMDAACKAHDVKVSTMFTWLAKNPALNEEYTLAREIQSEVFADEILDVAKGEGPKLITLTSADGVKKTVVYDGDVQRDRLIVDSLKWLMSKNHQRRFGDSSKVVLEGGERALRITADMSPEQAMREYQKTLAGGLPPPADGTDEED